MSATMAIGLSEAARILGLQEATVQSWARRGWLPSVRAGDDYAFNRAELEQWAAKNRHRTNAAGDSASHSLDRDNLSMHRALLRGGVHYDLPGDTRDDVLASVAELPEVPVNVGRDLLRDLLIEREQLASTGVGHGVAIPHPRNPLLVHVDEPVVALCFLRRPVDFQAIDGEPVRVLFSLLSPSTRIHLRLLARLAWLLRDEPLGQLLTEHAPEGAILDRVQFLEGHVTAPDQLAR
jgi:PTS system nitrogen regulatory IIA component